MELLARVLELLGGEGIVIEDGGAHCLLHSMLGGLPPSRRLSGAPGVGRIAPFPPCGVMRWYSYASSVTTGISWKFSFGGGEGTVHSMPIAFHGFGPASR